MTWREARWRTHREFRIAVRDVRPRVVEAVHDARQRLQRRVLRGAAAARALLPPRGAAAAAAPVHAREIDNLHARDCGSFHTSERRGGVERRQKRS
eukprot:30445-Pelagococcus_subviridis.AAC.6